MQKIHAHTHTHTHCTDWWGERTMLLRWNILRREMSWVCFWKNDSGVCAPCVTGCWRRRGCRGGWRGHQEQGLRLHQGGHALPDQLPSLQRPLRDQHEACQYPLARPTRPALCWTNVKLVTNVYVESFHTPLPVRPTWSLLQMYM